MLFPPSASAEAQFRSALHALQQNQAHLGIPAMVQAANQGHPLAQLKLAEWKATGSPVPYDPQGAFTLASKAAKAGVWPAMSLLACLLRSGIGVESDPTEADQWTRRAAKAGDPLATQEVKVWPYLKKAAQLSPVSLCDDPKIDRFPACLPAVVCQYLMAAAKPHISPSLVYDPTTGKRVTHPIRRSQHMNFAPSICDSIVMWARQRLAEAAGLPAIHGEALSVLLYGPGDEYRPHLDTLPVNVTEEKEQLESSGQRIKTMLVALNDGYDGGATLFTQKNIQWRGKPGEGLLFCNLDAQGNPNPLSRHAGQPVVRGQKWLLSLWIRERPYRI